MGIISLALGWVHGCSSVNDVFLMNMGKTSMYQTTTKNSKVQTYCIILGICYICPSTLVLKGITSLCVMSHRRYGISSPRQLNCSSIDWKTKAISKPRCYWSFVIGIPNSPQKRLTIQAAFPCQYSQVIAHYINDWLGTCHFTSRWSKVWKLIRDMCTQIKWDDMQ